MKHSCVSLTDINTHSLKIFVYRLLLFPPSFNTLLQSHPLEKKRLTLWLLGDIQGLTSSTVFCFASSLASSTEKKSTGGALKKHVSLQRTFELGPEVKRSEREHCRQNEVNMRRAKAENNLIALSSCSPLPSTPLVLLYIKAGAPSALPLRLSFCVCLLHRRCSAWCDVTFIKVQPSGLVDGGKDGKMKRAEEEEQAWSKEASRFLCFQKGEEEEEGGKKERWCQIWGKRAVL